MRLDFFNPRRLGRMALVVAVNLCLFVALIVAAELLLRWSALVPPMLGHAASDDTLWQHDPLLGWMTVPGVRTVRSVTGPDAGVIRVNEYGFRWRTLSPSRQNDGPRVLVFGDSFVFGVGIDEEHLFPAVLERNVPVPHPSTGQRAAVWLARHSRLWSGLRVGPGGSR